MHGCKTPDITWYAHFSVSFMLESYLRMVPFTKASGAFHTVKYLHQNHKAEENIANHYQLKHHALLVL